MRTTDSLQLDRNAHGVPPPVHSRDQWRPSRAPSRTMGRRVQFGCQPTDSVRGAPKRRLKQALVFAERCLITLTPPVFQPDSVEPIDEATPIANQSSPLQRAGGHTDGGPAGAKHFGQELVGQPKLVPGGPVVADQQPA